MNQCLISLTNKKYHYVSWKFTKKRLIASLMRLACRVLFFLVQDWLHLPLKFLQLLHHTIASSSDHHRADIVQFSSAEYRCGMFFIKRRCYSNINSISCSSDINKIKSTVGEESSRDIRSFHISWKSRCSININARSTKTWSWSALCSDAKEGSRRAPQRLIFGGTTEPQLYWPNGCKCFSLFSFTSVYYWSDIFSFLRWP